MMGIKTSGFDDFSKRLKDLERKAKDLQGTRNVSFEELFDESFMEKYTEVSTFEELLERGGFEVNSPEDFEAIPDDVFDEHVSKYTQFDDWQSMMQQAANEYAAKQLGF